MSGFWIFAAACVVAPWLVCRSFPRPENTSRAIKNDPRRLANRNPIDREDRIAWGDVPALPDLFDAGA